jgi:hypothetical protein
LKRTVAIAGFWIMGFGASLVFGSRALVAAAVVHGAIVVASLVGRRGRV